MDLKVVLTLAVTGIFILVPLSAMDDSSAESISDTHASRELPYDFDMRDVYGSTPVRNQNPTKLCLSFAEATALEYLVAKNGGELEWLSPYYLGYHHYDGYGREWSGDRNEVIFNEDVPFYDANGNVSDLTRLLSWITTVPDSVLPPYTSEGYGSYAFDDPELEEYMVRLTGVKLISIDSQVDDVKRMIMSGYGGILNVYIDPEYLCIVDGTLTYNSSTGHKVNHFITIVGWDDDYPKENFCQWPESDGAWLVKENFGTEGRGDGYIWISYESDLSEYAYFYDSLARESEDVLYDHCHGGYFDDVLKGYEVLDAANVFVATGDQMLTSIGLTSYSDYIVDYSVQIYTSLIDPNDPTSGTPALPEPQTGTIDLLGAYYVNLDTPVRLDEGETFSIVVEYEGDGIIRMMVNGNHDDQSFTNYVLPIPGMSFTLIGEDWFDSGAEGLFIHIRAYAETIDDDGKGTQLFPMMVVILLVAVVTSFVVHRD